MAQKTKIPRGLAEDAAEHLVKELKLTEHLVAGSLRRGRTMVHDVDFVVPMPANRSGADPLHDRIAELFMSPAETASLFGESRMGKTVGVQVKGVKPGFRMCQLEVGIRGGVIGIDIARYDGGPIGNRGWIEMIRTGPHDFAAWMLGQWKRATEGRSEGGYPTTRDGQRVACPTEVRAFALCGVDYIPAEQRDSFMQRLRARSNR